MNWFKKLSSSSSTEESGKDVQKKSLYQRYQDSKRGEITDEDIAKYTGKSRAELNAWADTQPGVGRNQLAGKLTNGPTSGFGGMAAGEGYGGWGPGSEPNGKDRGMKFPPQKEAKGDGK